MPCLPTVSPAAKASAPQLPGWPAAISGSLPARRAVGGGARTRARGGGSQPPKPDVAASPPAPAAPTVAAARFRGGGPAALERAAPARDRGARGRPGPDGARRCGLSCRSTRKACARPSLFTSSLSLCSVAPTVCCMCDAFLSQGLSPSMPSARQRLPRRNVVSDQASSRSLSKVADRKRRDGAFPPSLILEP